ncbi:MAG: hypothetical protein K2M42_07545 [Oscillospiraceae bacterium]|nr:hypothetical protein [Oscillospiraceae bacterium]
MKRRFLLAVLGAVMELSLSGCIFKPVDDLYALPVLPQEYRDLQSTINATMSELGAEYATINYGRNTSTVQLLDMDGDGEQETAAVFLRVTSADEKPMRVCLFRQGEDQTYRKAHILSGEGTTINSVAYEDLTGDGSREMIVSWQLSAGVHILSAYSFSGAGANELMSTTYNEAYTTVDLDQDGSRELLVFQQDTTGEGYNLAEYYDYQNGVMVLASTAPLSDGLKDVTASEAGLLSDGKLGVYVTLKLENGWLTDILTLEPDGLVNVTRDEESGVSLATAWTNTEATTADINSDGVYEIPRPQQLTPPDPESTTNQYLIYWQQVDSNGKSATSGITYHSFTDGWYLTLPNGWDINNITVARDDVLSGRGERAVVFYYWPDREESEPEKFLTIYCLTGNNRSTRSQLSGRVVLYSDSSAIYCAALDQSVWDCGLDEAELANRFKPILADWSANK